MEWDKFYLELISKLVCKASGIGRADESQCNFVPRSSLRRIGH